MISSSLKVESSFGLRSQEDPDEYVRGTTERSHSLDLSSSSGGPFLGHQVTNSGPSVSDSRRLSVDEAKEEAAHFVDIYQAFEGYTRYTFRSFYRVEQTLQNVPLAYQNVLETIGISDNLLLIREKVFKNHEFIHRVLDSTECFFSEPVIEEMEERSRRGVESTCSSHNMDKVRSTLLQFVRDWSAEGRQERLQSYSVILNALERYFPNAQERHQIKVLNPGCGLGRLPWEIANLGFWSQGNEFSYFMLMGSNFMLNHVEGVESLKFHPFVYQTNNVEHFNDRIRPVRIPDVSPASLPFASNFSMVAGDFLEVYGNEPCSWDCVVTCFFIDTCNNVLEVIESISRILKPGGLWINLGPLLYHYAEMEQEISVELAYSDLRKCFAIYGLSLLEEELGVRCPYTCNQRSMFEMAYKCAFSVCRKG